MMNRTEINDEMMDMVNGGSLIDDLLRLFGRKKKFFIIAELDANDSYV